MKVKKSRKDEEFQTCKAIKEYLDLLPEIKQVYFHIPNGEKRSPMVGARLKAMGVRRGIPDYFIPRKSGCGRWAGLFIEVKSKAGRPTQEQLQFMKQVEFYGYRTAVVRSVDELQRELKCYLSTILIL